jgi:uncharacterized membrane protein YgdD (TMEM256/DUF423 family)
MWLFCYCICSLSAITGYFCIMNRVFIKTAALLGALAVALGAFGAHGLKQILSTEQLAIFETGVRYQVYHVLALLATGILYIHFTGKYLLWAGRLFTAGIIIFSGSLYLLCWLHPQYKWLGAITPLGGVCFIAGWFCLFIGAAKK